MPLWNEQPHSRIGSGSKNSTTARTAWIYLRMGSVSLFLFNHAEYIAGNFLATWTSLNPRNCSKWLVVVQSLGSTR